jgi:hypothetical protein
VGKVIEMTSVSISDQLMAAFNGARTRYPELDQTWVKISLHVGSRLPKSLLLTSIQRDGAVDLLLRGMEDEQARRMVSNGNDSFSFHYQEMMSDYWIGGVYETFRLLRQRKLADKSFHFAEILADLELVRMPLEKHELPKDWKLEAPLQMTRYPPNNDDTDAYVYDPKDNQRAHIMGVGVSSKGSVMWHVIDLTKKSDRWVERQDLSDRILAMWKLER